jgi:hypothetical protein
MVKRTSFLFLVLLAGLALLVACGGGATGGNITKGNVNDWRNGIWGEPGER